MSSVLSDWARWLSSRRPWGACGAAAVAAVGWPLCSAVVCGAGVRRDAALALPLAYCTCAAATSAGAIYFLARGLRDLRRFMAQHGLYHVESLFGASMDAIERRHRTARDDAGTDAREDDAELVCRLLWYLDAPPDSDQSDSIDARYAKDRVDSCPDCPICLAPVGEQRVRLRVRVVDDTGCGACSIRADAVVLQACPVACCGACGAAIHATCMLRVLFATPGRRCPCCRGRF